jgi:hypothetical protein
MVATNDWDALRLFDEEWMPLLLPFCDIRITIPPEVGPDRLLYEFVQMRHIRHSMTEPKSKTWRFNAWNTLRKKLPLHIQG